MMGAQGQDYHVNFKPLDLRATEDRMVEIDSDGTADMGRFIYKKALYIE